MIRESRHSICIDVDPVDLQVLGPVLDEARHKLSVNLFGSATDAGTIVLLSDNRKVLAGTTQPEDECRAISTGNVGLVGLCLSFFRNQEIAAVPSEPVTIRRSFRENWLAWEDRKHRDLVSSLN